MTGPAVLWAIIIAGAVLVYSIGRITAPRARPAAAAAAAAGTATPVQPGRVLTINEPCGCVRYLTDAAVEKCDPHREAAAQRAHIRQWEKESGWTA